MAISTGIVDLDEDLEREPLLRADLDAVPVYPFIHTIKADIELLIDTPLQYEALMAPDLTYSIVQPLYERYSSKRNMSLVFCCLLNRVYLLRDRNLSTKSLSQSRAALCEILAVKLLRDWADSTLDLATVMTTSWLIFSGADDAALKKASEEREEFDVQDRVGNAIEMAIIGQAKNFIKSSACQKVIDSIWSGRIVYQAESDHAFLSDTYKRKALQFYDPHKAPLLDHYRLKVPAVRSVLEYLTFITLFVLYVIALEGNEIERVNWAECLFMIYAAGFTLDKVAAMQEHGLKVYSANLWNAFDIAFITIFVSYGGFRVYGLHYHQKWAMDLGIDILAMGACLMFPRLAFVTLSNNLMILSLRAMFVEFVLLMLVAAFCFCGFLYALWTLGRAGREDYSAGTITWWMLDLYFGLDASGFDKATTFHPYFGPLLMVLYACLSNTLLLTVLVSILSHTFSTVNSDAYAESMFRRAVSTIEGVKADALFSYQPPLNLFAFIAMVPLSYILNRRWFHKVNVFMIRVTAFPILLAIAVYERQKIVHKTNTAYETAASVAERAWESLPRRIKRMAIFDSITGSGSDIDAVFEVEEECQLEDRMRRISIAEHALSKADDGQATTPKATPTSPPPRSPRAEANIGDPPQTIPHPIGRAETPSTTPGSRGGAETKGVIILSSPPRGGKTVTLSPPSMTLTPPTSEPIPPPTPSMVIKPKHPDIAHLQRVRNRRESSRLIRERERRLSSSGLLHFDPQVPAPSPLAQIFPPAVVFPTADVDEPEASDSKLPGSRLPGSKSASVDLSRRATQMAASGSQKDNREDFSSARRRTQSAIVNSDRAFIRPILLRGRAASPAERVGGGEHTHMRRPASAVPEGSALGSQSEGELEDYMSGSRRSAKYPAGSEWEEPESGQVLKRLNEMEARQRRIENLLLDISSQLNAPRQSRYDD